MTPESEAFAPRHLQAETSSEVTPMLLPSFKRSANAVLTIETSVVNAAGLCNKVYGRLLPTCHNGHRPSTWLHGIPATCRQDREASHHGLALLPPGQ